MNFYELFFQPYETYDNFQIALEVIATIFGVLSVLFSIKKNIWVYPTGIISTALYVYILFNFGLLGDMMINFYYTVMSVYGWVLWSRSSKDHIHVEVSWATKKEWFFSGILFFISLILVTIVYYYKPFIDNHFSMDKVNLGLYHLDWANWLDIFTTAIFLVGMWLMAKRKIENWIFWIVGDLICIPMMIYKGLGITSIQYLVFTAMAIIGYFEWKKDHQTNHSK
ncbi:nicotinamide mononucleotide transporter [Kaistella flava (ex Peng et al. 2021)]|uniref:Nicotinamide riboside transporter PnuC n=1 Tax=Kaistella flava (ex Peng et al. 2021) TaxID=2038776 RepID=A0A7M2Y7Z2_9FLAO|nr:nicotinamide riboside transporter PnuC [Kaistella flava (ex Peng et al. 2021)]QOW10271.1 nicotinamide mononucleotide transporter [Kaistella flava (ex Peng et al. 2021)]